MKKITYDQNGTSLVELMIAITLSTFIALTASLFIHSFVALSLRAEKGDTIESGLDQMLSLVQNYAFYAVNVRSVDNSISLNGRSTGGQGQGYVRSLNIDSVGPLGGQQYTTLMFFAREFTNSIVNPNALASSYKSTAVFYRAPTATQPAAVIVHPGLNTNTTGTISATDGVVSTFEYISDVRLDFPQVTHSSTSTNLHLLSSIRFTAKAIYPIATTKIKEAGTGSGECYGPTADVDVACANSLPYSVVQKAVILNFANNKRDTFNSKNEFMNGLYFFKPYRGL